MEYTLLQNCTWPQAFVLVSTALIVGVVVISALCILNERDFPWQKRK